MARMALADQLKGMSLEVMALRAQLAALRGKHAATDLDEARLDVLQAVLGTLEWLRDNEATVRRVHHEQQQEAMDVLQEAFPEGEVVHS